MLSFHEFIHFSFVYEHLFLGVVSSYLQENDIVKMNILK